MCVMCIQCGEVCGEATQPDIVDWKVVKATQPHTVSLLKGCQGNPARNSGLTQSLMSLRKVRCPDVIIICTILKYRNILQG